MMKAGKGQDKKQEATSPRGGLLALRVLNALPYSDSVKDLYSRTKQSNEVFKVNSITNNRSFDLLIHVSTYAN
jgi:hypothetical protein